ncbi:hypothetical protein [Rhizobium sp. CAU 1783]
MIWNVIAVLTMYSAALNTLLAGLSGTCTGGAAHELWGVVLSIVLYLISLVSLFLSRNFRLAFLLCGPALPVLLWQTFFAVKLSFSIFAFGATACDVRMGPPSWPASGDELSFAILWPFMAFGLIAGLVMVTVGRGRIRGKGRS